MTSPPTQLSTTHNDAQWMAMALALAQQAATMGEVPVGAVVVDGNGNIIGRGHNMPIAGHDPTAHAEICAIRDACAHSQNYRLPPDSRLYVTLEPCIMCAGAIAQARVGEVIYAAQDDKGGALVSGPRLYDGPSINHRPMVRQGPLADESAALLRAFFRQRRGK